MKRPESVFRVVRPPQRFAVDGDVFLFARVRRAENIHPLEETFLKRLGLDRLQRPANRVLRRNAEFQFQYPRELLLVYLRPLVNRGRAVGPGDHAANRDDDDVAQLVPNVEQLFAVLGDVLERFDQAAQFVLTKGGTHVWLRFFRWLDGKRRL